MLSSLNVCNYGDMIEGVHNKSRASKTVRNSRSDVNKVEAAIDVSLLTTQTRMIMCRIKEAREKQILITVENCIVNLASVRCDIEVPRCELLVDVSQTQFS